MSDNGSIFQRLTQLFRSGPTIKRKVRPDLLKTSPTSIDSFKRSHNDVYSNVMSTHSSFDRMSRYSDFCLAGDTYIATNHPDQIKKIRDVVQDFESGQLDYGVFSYDHKSRNIVYAEIEKAWLTGIRQIWEVTLDTGDVIKCTDNHPFMLRNGEYVRADHLQAGQALMPFRRSESLRNTSTNEVISIVKTDNYESVYDITVKEHHNFALTNEENVGLVFVHNSEMEATPELSAGLDIYAEETVSADEQGRSLHIFCEDESKREILETLFYDTLNIEFNLTMWVRNLVKYGDFFLFHDIDPNYGIINAYPIPISEIEREEGFDPDNPSSVRFRWITRGNSTLENWQVSHFRLLGNDAFLPYGSSVLESARRIWRQLILIEDAMLVYRVIRAPERRVFYIDVGNVPPEDVPNYLEQATSALKKSPVIDKMTGKVDLRYNPLPVWSKTPIPLLDGRTITIEELAQESAAGKENWVYSIQDETHSIVPGRVSWCGKNYTAKQLTKVWLDDDTWVMTAPEHPFVMRDGTSRRADELQPGDSLMPLYRRITNRRYEEVYNPASESYEKTHKLVAKNRDRLFEILKETPSFRLAWESANSHNKRSFTKLAAKTFARHLPEAGYKDFYDFKKAHVSEFKNHKVTLIETISAEEDVYCMTVVGPNGEDDRHNFAVQSLKQDLNSSYNGIFVKNSVDEDYFIPVRGGDSGTKIDSLAGGQNASAIEDVEYIQKKLFAALKIPRAYLGYDETIGCFTGDTKISLLDGREVEISKLVEEYNEGKQNWVYSFDSSGCPKPGKILNAWETKLVDKLYVIKLDNGEEIKCTGNHLFMMRDGSYVRADELKSGMSCMALYRADSDKNNRDFASGYEKIYNHSTNAWVYTHKMVAENCALQEDETPQQPSNVGIKNHKIADVRIEILAEPVPVYDLEIENWSNFSLAVGIVVHNSKATLAQEDIRFSRTIQRIQKTVIAELNKIAMIHLYIHGFTDEDLLNFELKLSNPSSVAQLQKLELISTRFDIAGKTPEGMLDRRWVQKNVLGLTDKQILEIQKGRADDKQKDIELEAVVAPTGGGGEGGEEEGGLFSGDVPKGDNLLTSSPTNDPISGSRNKPNDPDDDDDEDAIDMSKLSINDLEAPIKAQAQISKKSQSHSPSKTHMPDFKTMVTHSRKQDSLNKPFGDDFLRTAFEGIDYDRDDTYEKKASFKSTMTPEMRSVFNSLVNILAPSNGSLLSESADDEIYFEEQETENRDED